MPEDSQSEDVKINEIIKQSSAESDLPPVTPPHTKTPVQFNQQVNVYQQIPQTAWDRLDASQVVDLSLAIIKQIDTADKRQFDYAIEATKAENSGKKVAIVYGAVIVAIGYSVSGYLALHGQTLIASTIAGPLAAILAVVVGRRFLD